MNTTTEQAITAKSLRPGDLITQGTLPNGTVATVEVHNWTVTVTYTDGREHFTSVLAILHVEPIAARLEALREVIRTEDISWGELAELQSLAPFIREGDTELLEWAGVPEHVEAVPSFRVEIKSLSAEGRERVEAFLEALDFTYDTYNEQD